MIKNLKQLESILQANCLNLIVLKTKAPFKQKYLLTIKKNINKEYLDYIKKKHNRKICLKLEFLKKKI